MSEVAVVDGQAGAGLSQMERVVDTFVAPSKTFSDILRNTTWWLPFLLAVVVTIGVTFVIDKQVGFERVVENVIHASPKQEDQLSSLTPEQRATKLKGMAVGYRYTSYASPIFILLFSAMGALMLWGSFNFGLGARTTFGQMFCLWMYCSLPRLLSGLLTVVTIYFGGNAESFDLKDPVGTNIGYYLPDAAPWLRALLGRFDVIQLWTVGLAVYGMSIVSKKTIAQSAMIILGLWLIVTLLTVGGAAMTS